MTDLDHCLRLRRRVRVSLMETAAHIALLEQNSARIRQLLVHLDPDTAVPTCPGWTTRDLIVHLGCTQRWATDVVAEAKTHEHWMDLDNYDLPTDDELPGWYTEGAARLADVLNQSSDDLDCWVFMSDVESPRYFWARRQAHETAIHRVDAEVVADQLTGLGISSAADGLDELVTGFWTRPDRGPRAKSATSVGFRPTDHPGRWTSMFDRDSCTFSRSIDADQVQVTAIGSAGDLLAWAWNRPTMSPLEFEGDMAAIERLKSDDDDA